jgi:hypothetical protein
MRVTNWQRWQRTKGVTAVVLFLIALGCIGGLEGDATTPIPSFSGFLLFISLSFALMMNITERLRQEGKI